MPKQTFFNLSEEKRQAILDTAIEAFAENDYHRVSISQMVAQLGIAKGSFYQYFADKQDLYFYVLDVVMQKRLDFVSQQPGANAEQDFFSYVQWLLEMGIRYDLSFPRFSQVTYRAIFGNDPFRGESLSRIKERMLNYQRDLLKLGVKAGKINPAIDLDLAAHMLNAIMADFGSLLIARFKLDPERLIQGDYSQIDIEGLRELLAQTIYILRYGLGTNG